jgi:hypothetical protein
MATYYKYAEREADSQVNWAEVGKNMSDMLAETNRVREEKKAAIDQATRDTMNELATSPNGEHTGARQAALEFANNASNYVRIQDNLLKRGQISLKEYTINRQNLNDGTDLAFNALKAYQANYGNTMQRYRDGKASLYETRQRQKAEGFGNFNKAALYINPTNGKVMSAMKTEKIVDGKTVYTMDDTPGKMASVDQINTMIVGEWDKYDYETPIKGFVDALGEEKTTAVKLGGITRQGKITSIEDITRRTDIIEDDKQKLYKFIMSENGMIESIIGPPINKLRVLMDSIPVAPNGKPYDITDDPEEAKKNPNLILEIINPSTGQADPVFTEEQTQDAEEFIRNQMRSQYDYKEEGQAVGAVSRDEESPEAKAGRDKDKELVNTAQMIGTLWGGANGATIAKATTAFRDINPNIEKVDRTVKGVTVTLKGPDGKLQKRELPFYGTDGKLMTQEQFILSAGPLLGGNADYLSAVKKGGYIKNAKFNDRDEEFSEVTREAPPVKAKTVTVTDDLFTDSDEDDSSVAMVQKLKTAGFSVGDVGEANKWTVENTGGFDDIVTVTAPNGSVFKYSSDGNPERRASDKAGLAQFIKDQQAP